jgi:hypothetical protein
MQAYQRIGPRWVVMAAMFPGRSSNAVRNRVFVLLRRKERIREQRSLPIPMIPELTRKSEEETLKGFFAACEPAGLYDFGGDGFNSMFFPEN